METEDDKGLLADALSDTPPAAEPEPAPQPTPEPDAGQPRDEQGRFAPKDSAAAPVENPPEPAATPAPSPQPQSHHVPIQVMLDEREKRQRHEREAEELRQKVEYLTRLVGQPQQPQTQQPEAPPDFFQNPDAYFDYRLDGPRREMVGALQSLNQKIEAMSQISAVEKYGEEAVSSAYTEIANRLQRGEGQHDYQRIMSSPHPYAELVKWHQRETNLSKIGNDPNAWLEAEIAKRMSDPTFVNKILEAERAKQTSNGSGRPAINLPPSLSHTPSAMGSIDDDAIDQDDKALLKSALRR